ncbi:MAG TPA: HAD family hydrolase [Candidatus Nanoarchaeia archaeon]|nr:HAD family hydrolase [Candidatus Nanoarchaeia archaeon]
MFRAIIFDVGGVILKGSIGGAFCEKVAQHYGLQSDHLLTVYRKQYDDYVMGKESQRQFFERFSELIGIEPDYQLLAKLFRASFDVDESMLQLIHKLSDAYDCIIASDNYKEAVEFLKEKEILKELRMVLFSCDIGLRKTNPEFFDAILEKYKPSECVYIDDLDSRIAIGKKIGFTSIKYTDQLQLEKELLSLSIIID